LPSTWDVLQALAESAGYRAEPSAAGRRSVAVLRLLGDEVGLSIVRSSLVYSLLDALRVIVTRQALQDAVQKAAANLQEDQADALRAAFQEPQFWQGQYDRQHFTWGQLKQHLGNLDVSRLVIRWLVEHRVLLRGYRFLCPNCDLRRWYPVDRIGERVTCDGCFEEVPAPVDVGSLQWEYRLNESVALAIDQGALPHVLASAELASWSRFSDSPELLGIYPGVLFKPIAGGRKVEADLVALWYGRAITGEFKKQWSGLAGADIDKLSELAIALNCSRVVYGAPDSAQLDENLEQYAHKRVGSASVEFWGAKVLLDPPRYEHQDSPTPTDYLTGVCEIIQRSLT
jgi:hypothetical protein